MGFKDYESKPVTRRAYEIQEEDVLWTSETPVYVANSD